MNVIVRIGRLHAVVLNQHFGLLIDLLPVQENAVGKFVVIESIQHKIVADGHIHHNTHALPVLRNVGDSTIQNLARGGIGYVLACDAHGSGLFA